jgi:hypothetical protein
MTGASAAARAIGAGRQTPGSVRSLQELHRQAKADSGPPEPEPAVESSTP